MREMCILALREAQSYKQERAKIKWPNNATDCWILALKMPVVTSAPGSLNCV